MMNEKVRQALENIVQKFKDGDIPEAVAISSFPIPNIPASKWSLFNRTMMFFAGTSDARGYRQWGEVRRNVKEGAKSFSILAPRIIRKRNEDGEEKTILAGFLAVPVFRVEDTEGEPLDYQTLELPELPLIEVAKAWGISVKAVPGSYRYLAFFSKKEKQIGLATKEETVFFHELAHAAHERVLGELKKGQDWKQEIVAELSAAVLCSLVGKTSKYLGNSYQYIERYSKEAHLSPWQGCMKVLSDVEKVLKLILKGTEPGTGERQPNPQASLQEKGLFKNSVQHLINGGNNEGGDLHTGLDPGSVG